MDYYTKVFLINLIVWIVTLVVDWTLLDDAIENSKVLGPILGLWTLVVLVSTPAYLIYVVATA